MNDKQKNLILYALSYTIDNCLGGDNTGNSANIDPGDMSHSLCISCRSEIALGPAISGTNIEYFKKRFTMVF
jgi:hypothetical protein